MMLSRLFDLPVALQDGHPILSHSPDSVRFPRRHSGNGYPSVANSCSPEVLTTRFPVVGAILQ